MNASPSWKTKNKMKKFILAFFILLYTVVSGQQSYNLGSGNVIWLHNQGDVNWTLGKDNNHHVNLFGYGDGARRFRILNGLNSQELFNVNFLTGNVGIGTTSPLAKLTIGSTTGSITSTTGIALGSDQNTIEFLNSSYGNGFGAKLYGLDQGNGLTSFRLAVRGNSSTWTDALFVHAGTNGTGGGNVGYIGIGTTTPTSRLDISDANSDLSILKLRNSAWACNQRTAIEFWNGGNKSYPTSRIVSQMDGCGADGEALLFETQTAGATSPSTKFIIKNDGNVGIGTTSPGSFKLAVNGKVWATEVQVTLNNPGPDYVFEKDYNLMSLEEIKAYIEKHKHLPEVPSAKEMEANGVNLSEMNMILLKKVEELTLHVIGQSKKIEDQQNQINKLTSILYEVKK
jgi:hypothetical protein